ncbi:hypothetical protein Tco_0575253 [Tanacetum coccineum]
MFVCHLNFNTIEEKKVRKRVNSGYVVENVLMGYGRAYVGNEGNKKYKEGTLCKGMRVVPYGYYLGKVCAKKSLGMQKV